MRFLTDTCITAGDTTGDLTSPAIDASNLFAASVQAAVVTAGTGTVKLQASNDPPSASAPSHWSDIPNASVATTGAGTYIIGKVDLAYRWIRVAYTHTSGTGTLTAVVQAIGF